MQKYALTFRICNNDENPQNMHFQKIRALLISKANTLVGTKSGPYSEEGTPRDGMRAGRGFNLCTEK
jgi:hypothetical protein